MRYLFCCGLFGWFLGCGCDYCDVFYYCIYFVDEIGGCRWRNYWFGNILFNLMLYKMSVVYVYDVVFGWGEIIFFSYSCFMNYIYCIIRNSSEKFDEWIIILY